MPIHGRCCRSRAQSPRAPGLAGSALVIIDAQGEYRSGRLPLDGIDAAVSVLALLGRARSAGSRIVHVVHRGKPRSLFDLDGEGGRVPAGLTPREGERIVAKGLPSSFAGTELQAHFEAPGRPPLIVAGVTTHLCVSSTVRAALDLRHATTVVGDATATPDLPGFGPDVVPASQIRKPVTRGDEPRSGRRAGTRRCGCPARPCIPRTCL